LPKKGTERIGAHLVLLVDQEHLRSRCLGQILNERLDLFTGLVLAKSCRKSRRKLLRVPFLEIVVITIIVEFVLRQPVHGETHGHHCHQHNQEKQQQQLPKETARP